MQTVMNDDRIEALARLLDDEDVRDVAKACEWDENQIDVHGSTYLVLTDAEAGTAARKSIDGSLWAFNPRFLAEFVPALREERAAKAWAQMVGELCEDANPLVEALLRGKFAEFYLRAIAADGRGHFLADYDHEEHEVRVNGMNWYIYRTN